MERAGPEPVRASSWAWFETMGEYYTEVNWTTGVTCVRFNVNVDMVFKDVKHAIAYDRAILDAHETKRLAEGAGRELFWDVRRRRMALTICRKFSIRI